METLEGDSPEARMERSLVLFREGEVSLWKAARLADVSLREMMSYAAAQGSQPDIDEATIQEELA
jgi:predicted HTH domain antitoxin